MDQDRRGFIKDSLKGMMACCALAQCPGLLRAESEENTIGELDAYIEKVSKEITYCAYRCSKTCTNLVASLEEDQKFLKDKAEKWSKDHDGKKIPEDQMFCFGCKPVDKPVGYVVSECTVRECAIKKEYSSCVECGELATCNKDLWEKYPKHREYVLNLQKEG